MGNADAILKLADVLRPECVVTGVAGTSKALVLQKIAHITANCPTLQNTSAHEIEQALLARERLASTGFGNGVAIPHCRLESVTEFVVGILTIPDGVDFDTADGDPVHLIIFIIAPADSSSMHVRILSEISQALLLPNATSEILSSATPQAARASFLRFAQDEIGAEDYRARNVIHVFVRDDSLFHSILQVFVALGPHSLVVLEGHDPTMYLAKMPLFSDFWGDGHNSCCRTLIAVLSAKLANEAIRRVEQHIGPLAEHRGVLVTVQEVTYTAGALTL